MAALDQFQISLDVVIRLCRPDDLAALEWFGLFAADRDLIRAAFARHEHGEAVMLVVEANGAVSGQAWIDLRRRDVDATGVIWAVRMLPCLQSRGIGTRLIVAAEDVLENRGFERAELTVEQTNAGARRLYERLGYRIVSEKEAALARAIAGPDRPSLCPGQWLLPEETPTGSTNTGHYAGPRGPKGRAMGVSTAGPIAVRWTLGDVSERGFEALRLSVCGAHRLFGDDAAYAVTVNSISLEEARRRVGPLRADVEWIGVTAADLPSCVRVRLGDGMAEGVGWKLAPARLRRDRQEISLDNDCILWDLPHAVREWLSGDTARAAA